MACASLGLSVEAVRSQVVVLRKPEDPVRNKLEDPVQTDSDDLGDGFKRVENLVWIRSNSFYWEALSDIKEQQRSLADKIKENRRRSSEVTNEVYNLIGFFSVFQGVILTAVTQLTQSTTALCGKVWFPLVLSGLAALGTVVGIFRKQLDYHKLKNKHHRYRQEQKVQIRLEKKLRNDGKNYCFLESDSVLKPLESYLVLHATLVIGLVCAVTVIFGVSFRVILCDKIL